MHINHKSLKVFFFFFFFPHSFVVTSCSTSGSATQDQWLPKGPEEMCVGLGPSARPFLEKPGQDSGFFQPSSEWIRPLGVLCAMPVLFLKGHERTQNPEQRCAGDVNAVAAPRAEPCGAYREKISFL